MKVKAILPDGSHKEFEAGTAILEVAQAIGPRLALAALAAKVDGVEVDLSYKLQKDSKVEIITFAQPEGKKIFWHSASHVLAHAVADLYPGTRLGVGPAIEEGFYHDMDVAGGTKLGPDDLAKIEARMNEIIKADIPIVREEHSKEDARTILQARDAYFTIQLLDELPGQTASFYRQGNFVDMCRGPHVPSTGKIKFFKLTEVSGAYWKGDAKNPMLQRVYGVAFPEKKALDEYVSRIEEAKKRDHRKIGSELDLFSVNDTVGAGLILYHPKGAILRGIIEDFEKKEHAKRGYDPVVIPHLFKSDTWKVSGHYDNYKENMYFTEIEGQEYGIKPMNCPGHIMIYNSRSHSYKELPVRYFELGTVYRHELSGVLSGLFRVRGFTQDDAHIFCTHEQLKGEIKGVIEFARFMLDTFGLGYEFTLSTRPEKAIGTDDVWEHATSALRETLEEMKLPYKIDEGGGAFYGPKIDVKMRDAIGRLWQGPTIQVDFNLPQRFDVNYVGSDGKKHRAVMVHRVVLGSMERFLGVLIEHYAGAFPLWLSPVQIMLIPLADAFNEHAKKIGERLLSEGFRVKTDLRVEAVEGKIRDAQLQKIPYMLVIGKREAESGSVSVRKRSGEVTQGVALDEFVKKLHAESAARK
ncbi:MAG: threonine--tRNA ligase [Candidatus Micrarchaeia archaeon]|jgi:threonyl-tRNA synthetase